MLTYNDIYELLRKEKYGEQLQALPKNFLEEFSQYIADKKQESLSGEDLFADSVAKNKKQLENSISLFKELILRRKKKLLGLIFVAAETGIMKRDYENMIPLEKEIFEKFVKAFEEGDKELGRILHGGTSLKEADTFKMILFSQPVEQFVDMSGNAVGPFNPGQLANLDAGISDILVQSGKASFVDEN
jgi:DNA replication initiation complex subunit (GINS family)